MEHYKFDQLMGSGADSGNIQPDIHLPLKKLKRKSPLVVAGVDEAGRGPLAGPVVAAAVILPAFPRIPGLNDSKVLTDDQREKLFPLIKRTALAYSVSILEPALIDELNILGATMKAMRDAIQSLKIRPEMVLVDGNQKPSSSYREVLVVKGDTKSAAIMAASIMAKVTRDRIMIGLHEQFPQYGFDIHKGYGVPLHLEMLKKFGPCAIHRRSFEPVKRLLQNSVPSERKDVYERWGKLQQAELF